jgi:hypothetical protein
MHPRIREFLLSATISLASAIYSIWGDRSFASARYSISGDHLSRLVDAIKVPMPKLTLCVLPPGVNLPVAGHRSGVILPCPNRLPLDISTNQVAGEQITNISEIYSLYHFMLAIWGEFSTGFWGFWARICG